MNLFNSKVSNLTRTSRTFEIFPHADKYKKKGILFTILTKFSVYFMM